MASGYDSERLAAAYAFDRPPIHERILRSAHLAGHADRALDVGCGAGLSTAALSPLARRVTGLEPIPAMLAHRRTVAPRARFVIGQAERLPFAAAYRHAGPHSGQITRGPSTCPAGKGCPGVKRVPPNGTFGWTLCHPKVPLGGNRARDGRGA